MEDKVARKSECFTVEIGSYSPLHSGEAEVTVVEWGMEIWAAPASLPWFTSLLYCLHAYFGTECLRVRNTKYSGSLFSSFCKTLRSLSGCSETLFLDRSEMFAEFLFWNFVTESRWHPSCSWSAAVVKPGSNHRAQWGNWPCLPSDQRGWGCVEIGGTGGVLRQHLCGRSSQQQTAPAPQIWGWENVAGVDSAGESWWAQTSLFHHLSYSAAEVPLLPLC